MKTAPFFLLGLLFALACASSTPRHELAIVLCQPPVTPVFQRGRASIVVPFVLAFDAAGSVAEIELGEPHAVDELAMRNCLGRWKAGGSLRSGRVRAEFYWEHGKGWQQVRLLAPGLDVKMELPPPG